MIVKMKKIIVLAQSKDMESALDALGNAGVLHIEHQNAPLSDSVTKLEEKHSSLSKAIEVLPDTDVRKTVSGSGSPEDLVHEILRLIDEREIILENLKKTGKDIERWEEWGDFDPGLIDGLKGKGILARLCKVTKKETEVLPEGVILERLFKKGNIFYCVAISTREIPLSFETLSLPEESLGEMLLAQKKRGNRIKEIDNRLIEISGYKKELLLYKKRLASLIEFNKAHAGMGRFEKILYLKGYVPVYSIDFLEKLAQKEKWGLLIEDPDENDNAPTLIKNPGWIEVIRPVFEIIKTVPGYREVDISFWFLLFFSVFFGMLVGDAGYGLIFFAINLLCHVKLKLHGLTPVDSLFSLRRGENLAEAEFPSLSIPTLTGGEFREGGLKNKVKDKSIFFLIYVLSICAILWGALTGTFFGQAYLSQKVPPLLPFLRDSANVQALCFFIGALHLSIAHAWRFIRKMPSLRAFSEAGWICVLWAAYFLAKSLILGEVFPEKGRWLFIGGTVLIVLCTNPTRNIFKTVGSGIGNFLLHVVNSFTDLVSYIRLFAVGAATVAVADAFNQMAMGIGYGNILAGFLTAFVLLFGHTLNILMGAMAVLVHGVRLNVLEFSSHLNMEWSGIEYRPFKQDAAQ